MLGSGYSDEVPPAWIEGDPHLEEWWRSTINDQTHADAFRQWPCNGDAIILARVVSTGGADDARPIVDANVDTVVEAGRVELRVGGFSKVGLYPSTIRLSCLEKTIEFDPATGAFHLAKFRRKANQLRGYAHNAWFSVKTQARAQVIPTHRQAPESPDILSFSVKQKPAPIDSLLDDSKPAFPILINFYTFMTDYINNGQVGAMGHRASATDVNQQQSVLIKHLEGVDLGQLAIELEKVATIMASKAGLDSDKLQAVANVARAKEAASKGDASGVVVALKGAGKWAQEVAISITAEIAAKALLAAVRLPV